MENKSSIVQYLKTRLDEAQRELAELERQRQELERKMSEASELYRATEAVLKAELRKRGLSDEDEASWGTLKPRLRTMTLKDAIRTVVRLKGQDGIHVEKILEWLQDAGFPLKAKEPKTSIAATIHLETTSDGTYQKVAPNTFKIADRTNQDPYERS
jgi:hypothetical protein